MPKKWTVIIDTGYVAVILAYIKKYYQPVLPFRQSLTTMVLPVYPIIITVDRLPVVGCA